MTEITKAQARKYGIDMKAALLDYERHGITYEETLAIAIARNQTRTRKDNLENRAKKKSGVNPRKVVRDSHMERLEDIRERDFGPCSGYQEDPTRGCECPKHPILLGSYTPPIYR